MTAVRSAQQPAPARPAEAGQAGASPARNLRRVSPEGIAARLGQLQLGRFSGFGLIAAMLIGFAFWLPQTFYTAATFKSVTSNQAITVMLALAVLVCLSAGTFDLSVAQNLGLGTVLCLLLMQNHMGAVQASLIAIAVCTAAGIINAFLIVWIGIDSIIGTLGTQSVLLAITEIISKDQYAGPGTAGFQSIASREPLGIPILVIYALILAVMVWYVMEHTPLGRKVHATGANPQAARLSGIMTNRYIAAALIFAGLIAGIAGVLLAAQLGTVSPTIGPPYLLPTYATVFLGATQIKPGRYNVGGLLVAVALLAIGAEGVELGSGATWVPDMFNGVALIVAVGLTVLVAKNQTRRASRAAEAEVAVAAGPDEATKRTSPLPRAETPGTRGPAILDRGEVNASFYTLSGAPVLQPSRFSLRDRAEAAARAGLSAIGLSVQDYVHLTEHESPRELRRVLDQCGISLHEVEFLYGWERGGGQSERWRYYESRLLEMAEALGATQLNAGILDGDARAASDIAESFRDLCDRARPAGLQVALEPMAMSWLRHVAQAEEIVSLAGAANGGILLDSYHFFRSGDDPEALAAIPPAHIIAIQVNDAGQELQGDLFEECVTRRELPGDGAFPLPELLATLDRIGVQAPITVEVMSAKLQRLPVRDAADRVAAAAAELRRRALDAAGRGH